MRKFGKYKKNRPFQGGLFKKLKTKSVSWYPEQ